MFSKELEVSISQAYQEARAARHEFLTVEHLLLALLDNASALSVLSACGADVKALEAELREALMDTVPVLNDEDTRETQPTIGFQRVLQHDTVLEPEDCGGPLVDLEGRVVGVNIARAGRIETLAIPAREVQALIAQMTAAAPDEGRPSSARPVARA